MGGTRDLVRRLQKRASRLSLFDIDTSPSSSSSSVCDGNSPLSSARSPLSPLSPLSPTPLSPLSPTPTFAPLADCDNDNSPQSNRRYTVCTPASPFFASTLPLPPARSPEVAPASTSPLVSPPATFQKLQPVEYIAPRPRRSRSISFETLKRRMSVLVASDAPRADARRLSTCPSPRLGPHGALVPSFLDDYDLSAPVPVRPSPRAGTRPMSQFAHALPPGAAEPVLGGIIFDAQREERKQPTQYKQRAADDDDMFFRPPRAFNHPRSNSMSAAESLERPSRAGLAPPRAPSPFGRLAAAIGAGHHRRGHSNMSRESATAAESAPTVPPRSRLRGPPPTPSMTSCDSSPTSTEPSPHASRDDLPGFRRPYVLDVAPPPLDVGKNLPSAPVDSATDDVIAFGRNARKKHSSGSSVDWRTERDPFKVRDGRSSQTSRSGVYTPKTFPGVMGRPPAPAPLPVRVVSQPPPARPSASNTSSVRARTMAGLKRFSAGISYPHHSHSHSHANDSDLSLPPQPQVRPSVTTAFSYSSLPSSSGHTRSNSHESYVTSPASVSPASTLPRTPHRASYSPSSAHSASSISPPGTPTTPISSASGCDLSPGSAVLASGDISSPFARADLDIELTPKAAPAPILADAKPVVPLSPTAPKRARRKPVPRFDEDAPVAA